MELAALPVGPELLEGPSDVLLPWSLLQVLHRSSGHCSFRQPRGDARVSR